MTRFTKAEQRTMVTLWSLFQSPLMLGGELTDLDEWTLGLITNEELNRMHSTLTEQQQEFRDKEWIIWTAENNESRYTAVFNVSDKSQKIPEKISQKELAEEAVELWSGRKLAELAGSKIDAHDCVIFRQPK